MELQKSTRRLDLAVAALLCSAVASAQPTAAAPGGGDGDSGVIATVNGEAIHFDDMERLLGTMHSGASATAGPRSAPDLDRAVFRLVNDTLLAQEARALGLDQEEPITSRLAERRESLAVAVLEREEIWGLAEPTEQEIAETFATEYRTLSFRMMTAHERETAEELLALLESGEDFATLAEARSVDPYAPRGGLVEDLPHIDMPRERAALLQEMVH